jgi:hypothetical protein
MISSVSDSTGARADLKNARRVPATKPDRLPPHSIEAEAGVLGCVLLSPLEYTRSLLSDLKSDSFYSPQNRIVFDAIATMHRDKQAIDVITLQQRLRDAGLLEQIGGIAYLAKLQDDVPSAANWDYYRDIVLEKYQLRKIAQTCAEIISRVYDSTCTVDELRFSAQSDLGEVFGKNGGGLPEIVDAAAFMSLPHPKPAELIEGVLHRGSKMSVSGNSKAYKTWIYTDLALSVSHSCNWLGFKTTPGKVLYVNFEIQEFAWHDRIEKLCKAKGIELKPGMLHFWNLRGYAKSFRELIPLIIARAQSEGYSLIILDPIYKLLGGAEENSATDIAELLNAFERLALESGAAIAYAHHFAKGNAAGKEAIDRQGGSGVFGRDPDSLLVFTAHEEPEAFTIEPILRNFAPIEPFVVRWNYPMMDRDVELDPAKLKQIAGRKKEYDPIELLKEITNNDELNPISLPQWAERIGIARTSLNRYVTDMRLKGWIKTIGEGSKAKQAITNSGKALIVKK